MFFVVNKVFSLTQSFRWETSFVVLFFWVLSMVLLHETTFVSAGKPLIPCSTATFSPGAQVVIDVKGPTCNAGGFDFPSGNKPEQSRVGSFKGWSRGSMALAVLSRPALLVLRCGCHVVV